MNDVSHQFRNAIYAFGLEPPEIIEAGKFHRFPGIGKKNGNTAAWCILFDDGLGGCFGDWSSGLSESWQAKQINPFSSTEHATFKRKVEDAKRVAAKEREENHAKAAIKASAIWKAATPASNEYPYLVHKNISPCGTRLYEGTLVLPLRIDSELHSLQFIDSDGRKKFLAGGRTSGCYFSLGNLKNSATLCIVEGFATGATIHKATEYPVAVAFTANNLLAVTSSMRKRFAELTLVICADDDFNTEGNPGIAKARDAALANDAIVAIPRFPKERPNDATDFNDMALLTGLDAVADVVEKAIAEKIVDAKSDDFWPNPQPLSVTIESVPYPLDALPKTLCDAVEEVQSFTKAPIPLVANSAIATLSLAAQAHANIERASKLEGPIGLFMLTIADSGERKSTCDHYFMQEIRNYELGIAEQMKPQLVDHESALQAWEAKHSGIKDKIRQSTKNGKPVKDLEVELNTLQNQKPNAPRIPKHVYADATPEALKWSLAKNWPSGGIVSSEAGIVFGAHGMNRESIMRNLATLNQLWDGDTITTERRSTESFTVHGARLTIALQVQEATLRSFFDRSDGLPRGTGFLARCLIAWPDSTQGTRLYSDPPKDWPALVSFNQKLSLLLHGATPINENGALEPTTLRFTQEAKKAWIKFHDFIEQELGVAGELHDVRDVASKIADNAARLATLFHVLEYGLDGEVTLESFESASRVAAWHLHEARRFFNEIALPEKQLNVIKLENWLIQNCKRNNITQISRRDVQRNVTPCCLRDGDSLELAINELIEADRIRLHTTGKQKLILVNPALLKENLT